MEVYTWYNEKPGHFYLVGVEEIGKGLKEEIAMELSWLEEVPHYMKAKMGGFKGLGCYSQTDPWEKSFGGLK